MRGSGRRVLTSEDTIMSLLPSHPITSGSINCNGFKRLPQSAEHLLCNCDIICLQETMLTKQECELLNSFHDNYYGYGVAPVDAALGIISGRPRGGVGILWKTHLDECVSIIESEYDWLCCIRLSDCADKEYYLINVYLPYDCMDNRDEFIDCLAKLKTFIDCIDSTCITVVGDFNANLSRTSLFGDILQQFCIDNSFCIVDVDTLPTDTYTYVSYSWGTTSWLDHVLCTGDAKHCTSNLEVRYECVLLDHHPVLGNIDINIITACHADNGRVVIPIIKWDKLPVNAVQEYELKIKVGVDGINIPDGVKCINPNCRLPSHANYLNTFHDCITTVLIESSAGLENACGASSTYNVPGWNDHVKNLHAAARDAYLLWKSSVVGLDRELSMI